MWIETSQLLQVQISGTSHKVFLWCPILLSCFGIKLRANIVYLPVRRLYWLNGLFFSGPGCPELCLGILAKSRERQSHILLSEEQEVAQTNVRGHARDSGSALLWNQGLGGFFVIAFSGDICSKNCVQYWRKSTAQVFDIFIILNCWHFLELASLFITTLPLVSEEFSKLNFEKDLKISSLRQIMGAPGGSVG